MTDPRLAELEARLSSDVADIVNAKAIVVGETVGAPNVSRPARRV